MPTDPRDYKLEVSGVPIPSEALPAQSAQAARPWLSVWFNCCRVYQRVYRHRDGGRYEGRCPRCGAKIVFAVGEGGTEVRRFVVE